MQHKINEKDLQLQIDSGVDVTLSDVAIDRLSTNTQSSVTKTTDTINKGPSPQQSNITISSSAAIADNCQNLDELQKAIQNFDGLAIKKTALNTVFADGVSSSKVMLIGEAPGADEDKLGKPFVGRSGKLLDSMFRAIGLSREENLYITNVINWRPPGNRPPTNIEIETCLPFLLRHIELISPEVIVMLGATSLKAVTGNTEPISKIRGKIENIDFAQKIQEAFNRKPKLINGDKKNLNVKTITMYHPSYLLRSPSKKSIAMLDLIKIKEIINSTIN